jgi:hypothetical protein
MNLTPIPVSQFSHEVCAWCVKQRGVTLEVTNCQAVERDFKHDDLQKRVSLYITKVKEPMSYVVVFIGA